MRGLTILAALALGAWSVTASTAGTDSTALDPGLDMIMVDPADMPAEPELAEDQPQVEDISWSGAPIDLLKPIHHLYTDYRRQLLRYQESWSKLPQVRIPPRGGPLTEGADNKRVHALRERLGLNPAGSVDGALESRIAEFQRVHGLPVDGKAGPDTLAALNRGALHFERKLLLNMERARRLPAPGVAKKYVLVDAGSARLWMYENGVAVDSMKVVVGAPESATPMMGALMRYANVNPYWNVPADLVGKLIAPRVLSGGISYLSERRYEALDGWEAEARVVDPMSVDWAAVAEGRAEQRVRQLPGGANSMGAIKFMMPNEYGIYLHDTPNKALFAGEDRWVSNGCVRLEDAERLARWIFGAMPRPADPDKEDFLELFAPLPVYITYLTAEPGTGGGALFRADPYKRDAKVMARFADEDDGMREARPVLTIDLDEKPKKAPAQAEAKNAEAAKVKKPATTKPAKPAAKEKAAASSAKTKAPTKDKVATTTKAKPTTAAKAKPTAKTKAAPRNP